MHLRYAITLLQVFDMPRSIAFYHDVLGFAIIATSASSPDESFYWAMLQRDELKLMLNTAYEDGERPPSPNAARTAAHGDTILFFGCDSADDVYSHLRARDWHAEPPVTTHYGMRQVYTQDPDGYGLCFQHPIQQSESS